MKQTHLFKDFFQYTTFNVLGMIGLSCYILADTFFIAKGLGANGLAALNLAIPVYSFIHGCGLMIGMGGATRFSILKGQKKMDHTNSYFTCTVYLALMLSAVYMLLGCFFSKQITSLLGADATVFQMTNTYLKVDLFFAPAHLLNDVMLCFVRNDGRPKLSMQAMLMGSISNIILDYIFIFPLQMGIFGAVLATGLAPVISLLTLSSHWFQKKNTFHLKKTKPAFSMVRSILSLGFPSLVAEVSSGIVMIVFNTIILHLEGNVGVAAYGVIANISLVVIAVYTGIAQGIQPLISSAYGQFNQTAMKQILRYALSTMAVVSSLLYLLLFFFAGPITAAFNSEKNIRLQQIAEAGLKLYFLAALFVGFNIVISMFFTASDHALPAHMISLLRGLILIIPMAFLLSYFGGLTGIWLSFPVTEGLTAIFGMMMYLRLYLFSPNRKE